MAGEAFGLGAAKAEAKAALARAGLGLRPGMAAKLVPKPEGAADYIVLERVVPGTKPVYCIHGYAQCMVCYELCWLGDKTYEVVSSGQANPLCEECAREQIPRAGKRKPDRHVDDRLRSQGPHT